MKLNIEINEEVPKLPQNVFTDKLKDIFDYQTFLYKEGRGTLEGVQKSIRDAITHHKTNSPNFKSERYFIVLLKDELTIRFGDSGLPQIVITESE